MEQDVLENERDVGRAIDYRSMSFGLGASIGSGRIRSND